MTRCLRPLLLAGIAALHLSLSACGGLSYYHQSVAGQLALFRAQEDFETVFRSPDVSEAVKKRLRTIAGIRDFASEALRLPENDSYRSYADIGRRYIVWNVFATPALSLAPYQSCFLIIGCLSYRGYFDISDARSYMEDLEKKGYDVYLGGVAAYSTLGWFDDPVLNGMLERSDTDLARLIFHELAHQKLYIRGDTAFNEAFADALALIGLRYWLECRAAPDQRRAFEAELARENQFTQLVLAYREKLAGLYRSNLDEGRKLEQKRLVFAQLRRDYESMRATWGDYDEYDGWFGQDLNNAKITAVSTYRRLVPLFIHVFEAAGRDIERFYAEIKQIAACPRDRRRELLRNGTAAAGCG